MRDIQALDLIEKTTMPRLYSYLIITAALTTLLGSCTSIVSEQQEACDSNDECRQTFGLGSQCLDSGYCSAPGDDATFVNGVSTTAIRTVGIADITGSLKDLGQGMTDGVRAAYNGYNLDNPSSIQFIHEVRDDKYNPVESVAQVTQVTDSSPPQGRYAFAIVGSMGSPTSAAMLATINERQVPLFGTYSGANHLRNTPPDRMVWNTRASYSREGEEITTYLIERKNIAARNIFAFSQAPITGEEGTRDIAAETASWLGSTMENPNGAPLDPYGLSGYRGIINILESRGVNRSEIPLASYRATSTNTTVARNYFFRWLVGLEEQGVGKPNLDGAQPQVGIAMVPVASAASDFVTRLIDDMELLKAGDKPSALSQSEWDEVEMGLRMKLASVTLTLASISPVGDQLANNLEAQNKELYCGGDYPIFVSQVVPFPNGESASARAFRQDIQRLDPNIEPGYVNFEGWIAAKVFIDAVNQVDGELTSDKVVEVLERNNFRVDLQLGEAITFPGDSHDGLRLIFGSSLNTNCDYVEIPL